MPTLLLEFAYALWFILPAYVANAIPVLLGGGRAIDGGKTLPDGKPIFGSHKTIRGFVAGLTAGTLTGAAQTALLGYVAVLGFVLPFRFSLDVGFILSLGALTGDLIHSFVKRRIGIREGAPLPVADQLDFVVGALVFSFAFSQPSPLTIIIVLLVTPPIHLLTNLLAYVGGVKKTPW